MRRFRHGFGALLLAAILAWSGPGHADDALPDGAAPAMTTGEFQSLSCLGVGTVSATTATVLIILSPLEALTAPVIAGAFAAGCGFGAVAGPGVRWIYRTWGAEAPKEPA